MVYVTAKENICTKRSLILLIFVQRCRIGYSLKWNKQTTNKFCVSFAFPEREILYPDRDDTGPEKAAVGSLCGFKLSLSIIWM